MTLGNITTECAYELLVQTRNIPGRLKNRLAFEDHVHHKYEVKNRLGLDTITIDEYLQLQRELDPNKEVNGIRNLKLWPGPKVPIGNYRLDPRPRWDRRQAMTIGWEIEKNLSEFVNRNLYHRESCTSQGAGFSFPVKILKGNDQYWHYLSTVQ